MAVHKSAITTAAVTMVKPVLIAAAVDAAPAVLAALKIVIHAQEPLAFLTAPDLSKLLIATAPVYLLLATTTVLKTTVNPALIAVAAAADLAEPAATKIATPAPERRAFPTAAVYLKIPIATTPAVARPVNGPLRLMQVPERIIRHLAMAASEIPATDPLSCPATRRTTDKQFAAATQALIAICLTAMLRPAQLHATTTVLKTTANPA